MRRKFENHIHLLMFQTLDAFPFPHNTIDFAVRTTLPLPVGQECRFIGWGSQVSFLDQQDFDSNFNFVHNFQIENGATITAQSRVNAPILGNFDILL